MALFVLVHGAWCGGWTWQRVQAQLEAQGHTVLAPPLTGMGERAGEAGPDTGLRTHVLDIETLLDTDDLTDVTLVGHSYGGMVATGVLGGPQAGRVSSAILVDAFLPMPGQSAFDLLPWLREAMVPISEKPWATAPMDFASLGVVDPDDLSWLAGNTSDLPLRTHTEPLGIATDPAWGDLNATYLLCTEPLLFGEVSQDAARRGLTVRKFPGGHMPMVTDPTRLTEALNSALNQTLALS
jgi:pimeloyl-ACP methyl ester carboxylesterase